MSLTEHETAEIERANASGLRPVMFVHGLWLLSSSWDRWRGVFEEAGYTTIAPGWPDDPETVSQARENPEVFARKMVREVTDHYLAAASLLRHRPAVVGHSFGGLVAQKIAGDGVSVATVAIDPAPFQGVLPIPAAALKSAFPVVSNPANTRRAVTLTFEQFCYGWANALDETESRELYETYHVAAAGNPIFQAVTANLNPFSETKVDTKNPGRGPLLIISGEADHTVPYATAHSAYRIQERNNDNTTAFVELPNRGHSLTIDHGWAEVAATALEFVDGTGVKKMIAASLPSTPPAST